MSIDILIGHRLPLYREVLAATIEAKCPDLVVQTVLREEVEERLLAERPWMVVCCVADETIRRLSPNWIMICPDERDEAVVSISGEVRTIPHASIQQIVDIVKRLQQLRPDSPARGMEPGSANPIL